MGGSAGNRGSDRRGVDRAVVKALGDRRPHEPVLVDPRQARELRRSDNRPKVIPTCLVHDLHLRAGERQLDQLLDLLQVSHAYPATGSDCRATSTISSTLQSLIRGRPWGSPAAFSAASIASHPSYVTCAGARSVRSSSIPGSTASRSGTFPASRSANRLSTVSCASFLLVPITPEGPRLIQPTA